MLSAAVVLAKPFILTEMISCEAIAVSPQLG
jgi:hypothetical protein